MTTFYVRTDGNDANGGTDPDTDAKLTIASAISVSANNDTVDVGEGTFTDDFTAARTFAGAGMFKTTINGVCVYSGEKVIGINNLKLINNATNHNLDTLNGSNFENVFFDGDGRNTSSNPFTNSGTDVSYTRCIFTNFQTSGSKFLRSQGGKLTIDHCVFYNTNTGGTSFLTISSGEVVFINSIFDNINFGISAGTFTATYNCVNNVSGDWSRVTGGTGAISADPLFVDAAGGDFRLRATSPCIGAGL